MARPFRRIRSIIQNPKTTVILAALLFADVRWITTAPWNQPSTVGAALWQLRHTPGGWPQPAPFPDSGIFIVRAPEPGAKVRVVDTEIESWDGMSASLRSSGDSVARIVLRLDERRFGFWARTTSLTDALLRFDMLGGNFSAEELTSARVMVLEHIMQKRRDIGTPESRAFFSRFITLEGAPGAETRVLWWGIAHTLAAGLGVLLFLYSLGWIPGAVRDLRMGKRAARLSRGECPKCRYSITGLSQCPECGALLTPVPPSPPAPATTP